MRKRDLHGKRSPEAEAAVRLAGHAVDDPDPAGALREVLMIMGFTETPEVEAHRRHPAPQRPPGNRTTTRRPAGEDVVSDCCGAPLETAGSVTRYYVCTECDMPCDSVSSSLNTRILDKLAVSYLRGRARR